MVYEKLRGGDAGGLCSNSMRLIIAPYTEESHAYPSTRARADPLELSYLLKPININSIARERRHAFVRCFSKILRLVRTVVHCTFAHKQDRKRIWTLYAMIVSCL